MALECFVYETAKRYEQELPTDKLRTWQPRKLLRYILEADPGSDQELSLHIGTGELDESGQEKFERLGTSRPATLAEIKKHYDAIGAILHVDSPFGNKGPSDDLKRTRCEAILGIVQQILDASIMNMDFKAVTELRCVRCDTLIIKRVRTMKVGDIATAECAGCAAGYDVHMTSNEQFSWRPHEQTVPCLSCEANFTVWNDQVHPGATLVCPTCNSKSEIGLVLRLAGSYQGRQIA